MSVSFKAAIPINFSNAFESITNVLISSASCDLEEKIEDLGHRAAFYQDLATRKSSEDLNKFVIDRITLYGILEADKDTADKHLLGNYDLEHYQVDEIRSLLQDYVQDILEGPIRTNLTESISSTSVATTSPHEAPDYLTLVDTKNEGLQTSLHFIATYVDRIQNKKYTNRHVTKYVDNVEVRLTEGELLLDELGILTQHVKNVGGCIDHFTKRFF